MSKMRGGGWHAEQFAPEQMIRFNKLWSSIEPFIDERDHVAARATLHVSLREFLPTAEDAGKHDDGHMERRYASRPKDRPQEVDIEARAAEVRASWTDEEHAKRSVVDVRRTSVLPALPVETRRSVHRSDAS